MANVTDQGTWLYHRDHQGDELHGGHAQGRLFKPSPDADQLAKLDALGWVDTPTKLVGTVDPVEDTAGDVMAIETPPSPTEAPLDIRTMRATEALAVIVTLSDVKTLQKIRTRESTRPVPKGGRKTIVAAIDARLDVIAPSA